VNGQDAHDLVQTIENASRDVELIKLRLDTAQLAADTFLNMGRKLQTSGQLIGTDRIDKTSPFGFGTDEVVGVGVLLQMASQLTSASAELLTKGRPYAGAALLRQMVEIEYLAWAFDVRDADAERWLRSDKQTRQTFFKPSKLREAAQGKFRAKDYGYHCEMGGHPVPTGMSLLQNKESINQLLLSDLIGHVSGIWEHFVCWAERHETLVSSLFSGLKPKLPESLKAWHSTDPLVGLPRPP